MDNMNRNRISYLVNSSVSGVGKNIVKHLNTTALYTRVDPDEPVHNEPSHRDLHCMRYIFSDIFFFRFL